MATTKNKLYQHLSLQHDVLDLAPNDTGCRCAMFESMLRQLFRAIDDANLSVRIGDDVERLLAVRHEAEAVMRQIYGNDTT